LTTKVDAIWHKVSQLLKQQLNSDVFARWIAVISPNRIADNTLFLNVSNNFYQSWLEENYLTLIKNTVNTVCDQEMRVVFEVITDQKLSPASDIKPATEFKPGYPKKHAKANTNEIPLNPKYTFASFVIGSSNSFAHASSLAVAQAPGKAYNPLFIYGGVGLGKTHLMQAIGHHVGEKTKLRINYLSCEALLNEYIDALKTTRIKQFRDKYRGTDLLLIDDIHFLTGKSGLQEEFFHTFNALLDAYKQIVITSDRSPGEISGLEQRLVSRFEWGQVTELTQPDFETRVAILRCKQQSMNVALNEDVLSFIAVNIKSNIRRLEGALIRLVSYAALYNKQINVSLAEQLLQDIIDQEAKDPISIAMIQKNAADFFDIRLADMTSSHRSQNIALPRQVAMYLCRKLTNSSSPEIGAAFGKTHATVLHACRKIERSIIHNKQLKQTVSRLSKYLKKNVEKADNKL
jgi:chromosomal replication initiator protein